MEEHRAGHVFELAITKFPATLCPFTAASSAVLKADLQKRSHLLHHTFPDLSGQRCNLTAKARETSASLSFQEIKLNDCEVTWKRHLSLRKIKTEVVNASNVYASNAKLVLNS